jgi:hypothetical protein
MVSTVDAVIVTNRAYIHPASSTSPCLVCDTPFERNAMVRIAKEPQGLVHEACACERCGVLVNGQHQELCGTGLKYEEEA